MIITLSFRADKIGEESHHIQFICYAIPRFTRNDKGEVLLAFWVCLANKKGKSCAGCGTVQRKVKKDMKKKVFSLALVICCLAVFLTSSTLAYFTKEDTATNVITTGKIDIDLVEKVVVDPETGETIHYTDETGPVLLDLYNSFQDIQYGRTEDKYGWTVLIEQ